MKRQNMNIGMTSHCCLENQLNRVLGQCVQKVSPSSLHRCYWKLRPDACLTAGGGPYRNFGPCDYLNLYFYLDRDPYVLQC